MAVLLGPVFSSLGILCSNAQQTICPDWNPPQTAWVLQEVPWREKAGVREGGDEKTEEVVSRRGGWGLGFAEQVTFKYRFEFG